MPKKRVHEIAKEQGLTSKEVLQAFKDAGVYVKAASSTVEERDVKRAFPNGAPAKAAAPPKEEKKPKKAEAPAVEAPAAATPERTDAGKAKVTRAKPTKGPAKAPADSSAASAAKGGRKSTDSAEAPAST